MEIALILLFLVLTGVGLVAFEIRRKEMSRWIGPYWHARRNRRAATADEEVHVLLCIADHYEPKAYEAPIETGRRRVAHWAHEYPKQFSHFRDSDGRPPRYSFFFPAEEYEPEYLDQLAVLCRAGYGEVELHLHHHNDTAESLRDKIETFKKILIERHGLLSRDPKTGEDVYAFIHGNWALNNSRPDGACCGVDHEIPVLKSTGCYADMTFPSAPHVTQPPILNQIYYARDIPGRRASHEVGVALGEQKPEAEDLLFLPGPLVLDWKHRKWGLFPRLENGCLQGSQLPSLARLDSWLRARVQVPSRPDWFFVKLHAHGAPEDAHDALLGAPMVRFHEELAERARANPRFHYHYVTAREMVNLAKAAEAGFQGNVNDARDYWLVSNIKPSSTNGGG